MNSETCVQEFRQAAFGQRKHFGYAAPAAEGIPLVVFGR